MGLWVGYQLPLFGHIFLNFAACMVLDQDQGLAIFKICRRIALTDNYTDPLFQNVIHVWLPKGTDGRLGATTCQT